MASQMADAKGETVTVRLAGGPHGAWEFSASGTSYIEEGFRAVYSDISGDAGGDGDNELPAFPVLVEGEAVSAVGAQVKNHNTLAPARFTEASLVKELEELGIGRPSTYSSIIGKLRARYVWSRDGERALIPTLTAFAVWRMLMENFAQLVDYDFTSAMEEDLDSVANGEALSAAVLNTFYFGVDDKAVWPGLEALVQHTLENVDPRDMFVFDLGVFGETGEAVVVRPGKMKGKSFSPYMECGKVRVSLPDETALDELTPERVAELMAYKEKVLGHIDAVAVMLRFGSRGYFFQLGATGELPSGWTKPRFAGLLSAMDPVTVTLADAELMLSLPRVLGVHPETGDEVCALKGLYGPYIKCAADTRQLPSGVPPIAVECSVTYGGA